MLRRAGFIAVWVIATFATGLVAWGAVRIAGSQVSDQAVRPLSAAEVEALPLVTVTADAPMPATTAPRPTTTEPDPIGPVVAPPASSTSTTTSTRPVGTAPTSTTRPPPSTTSPTSPTSTTATTAAAPPEVRTYQTGGGSVTIRVSSGVVELGGASPAPGFTVDVEKAGPTDVEVKFESTGKDEEEYEFSARWRNGELVIEID